ncbi:RNA-binding protein [filamentous cyanobacterium CCP5]|nr:RNA-binding protein [filamentous cyanobacterium CCP5]
MSVRLYVGNLPKELEREKFESIFAEHSEELVSVKLIADKKTGKCRGFGFVTVKTDEKADQLVEQFNGYALEDSTLKVEKALPRSKGKDGDAAEGSSAPRRKGSSNKKATTSSSSSGSSSAQPDPRWADELEKLKQMLATQTSST